MAEAAALSVFRWRGPGVRVTAGQEEGGSWQWTAAWASAAKSSLRAGLDNSAAVARTPATVAEWLAGTTGRKICATRVGAAIWVGLGLLTGCMDIRTTGQVRGQPCDRIQITGAGHRSRSILDDCVNACLGLWALRPLLLLCFTQQSLTGHTLSQPVLQALRGCS